MNHQWSAFAPNVLCPLNPKLSRKENKMNEQPLFDRMPAIAQIGFLALIVLTSPVWGLAYLLEGINKK